MEYSVGDRVQAIIDHPWTSKDLLVGDIGTVCFIESDDTLGVEWDRRIIGGHNCYGHCEDGYGWYVGPGCIKLYEEEAEADIDEESFLGIVFR